MSCSSISDKTCLVRRQDAERVACQSVGLEWIASERTLTDRSETAERELELKLHFVGVEGIDQAKVGRPAIAGRFKAGAVLGVLELVGRKVVARRYINSEHVEDIAVGTDLGELARVRGRGRQDGDGRVDVVVRRLDERPLQRLAHVDVRHSRPWRLK